MVVMRINVSLFPPNSNATPLLLLLELSAHGWCYCTDQIAQSGIGRHIGIVFRFPRLEGQRAELLSSLTAVADHRHRHRRSPREGK